jgi:hypothetical protein
MQMRRAPLGEVIGVGSSGSVQVIDPARAPRSALSTPVRRRSFDQRCRQTRGRGGSSTWPSDSSTVRLGCSPRHAPKVFSRLGVAVRAEEPRSARQDLRLEPISPPPFSVPEHSAQGAATYVPARRGVRPTSSSATTPSSGWPTPPRPNSTARVAPKDEQRLVRHVFTGPRTSMRVRSSSRSGSDRLHLGRPGAPRDGRRHAAARAVTAAG